MFVLRFKTISSCSTHGRSNLMNATYNHHAAHEWEVKMSKHQYLNLCMRQTPDYLLACAADPSKYMRPIHVKLIRIALRRMGHAT